MSYGPPGVQQYGGHRRASRRNTGLLVGGAAVVLVVVIALIAALLLLRNRSDDPPTERTSTGGVMTGEADRLADALTKRTMECSVRYTFTSGGVAGCFGEADKGETTREVRFQYQADGTVIGVNAKSWSREDALATRALASLVKATGAIVFPKDASTADKALKAVKSVSTTGFDGSWGKYRAKDGIDGTTFAAGKNGVGPLTAPGVETTTTAKELADALKSKGLSCDTGKWICTGNFRDGEGDLEIRPLSLGPKLDSGGITNLNISATDISKHATATATRQAFENLATTTLGMVRGDGLQDVARWIQQRLDGRSHTAYVGGWRVELRVTYDDGTPAVPIVYGVTIATDTALLTPDK
jgi:hypothetical protein